MITLYARKEATQDSIAILHGQAYRQDVVLYADKEGQEFKARWVWHLSSIPTKRNKYVTLNCNKYKLEWIS